jgi:hypothetical protein
MSRDMVPWPGSYVSGCDTDKTDDRGSCGEKEIQAWSASLLHRNKQLYSILEFIGDGMMVKSY